MINNEIGNNINSNNESFIGDGLTVKEMWALLPDGYSYNGLHTYMRVNGLLEMRRRARKMNSCDKCENCIEFKNVHGNSNKANRLCLLSKRVISTWVVDKPTWCEKVAK